MVGALGVLGHSVAFGELTLVAAARRIVETLTFLRDDRPAASSSCSTCGVDYPEREERFDVVYHLLSLTRNARIRVKV
jgi:NADH-quinone oxidoreductase subunit C